MTLTRTQIWKAMEQRQEEQLRQAGPCVGTLVERRESLLHYVRCGVIAYFTFLTQERSGSGDSAS